MRLWPLLALPVLAACGKGGSAAAPAIVGKISVLKGQSPAKVIDGVGGDLFRYEVKRPYTEVLASLRKDAAAGGWEEMSPTGEPGFVAKTPGVIANVSATSGKLAADGLTTVPDPGTTVVGVVEVKAAP